MDKGLLQKLARAAKLVRCSIPSLSQTNGNLDTQSDREIGEARQTYNFVHVPHDLIAWHFGVGFEEVSEGLVNLSVIFCIPPFTPLRRARLNSGSHGASER